MRKLVLILFRIGYLPVYWDILVYQSKKNGASANVFKLGTVMLIPRFEEKFPIFEIKMFLLRIIVSWKIQHLEETQVSSSQFHCIVISQ